MADLFKNCHEQSSPLIRFKYTPLYVVYLLLDDSPEVLAEMPVQCVFIDRFVNGSICHMDIPDDRDEQKGLQSAVSPLPLTVCHVLDQFHTGEDGQN